MFIIIKTKDSKQDKERRNHAENHQLLFLSNTFLPSALFYCILLLLSMTYSDILSYIVFTGEKGFSNLLDSLLLIYL